MENKKHSKFEKAKVIGTRTLQLSSGAPIKTKSTDKELEKLDYNPIKVAEKEFEEGKIPLKVRKKETKKRTKTE